MKPNQKFRLAAACVLLIAVAIPLWPSGSRSLDSTQPVASTRAAHRIARPPSESVAGQRRTFHHMVKLVENGEIPKLPREQIDIYLQARHRSAGSLLAAYRMSKDEALLREAMEKFPNDPEVLVAALELPGTPAKRLEILSDLKRADPGNSIANCLSARIFFDLGNNDEALAELSETFGKSMRDYNLASMQNVEEAYLSAGYSTIEAKLASMTQATKLLLSQMRNVADGLKKQRETAAAAGDEAAVRTSQEIQMEMVSQLRGGNFLIDTLVAANLEKKVLKEIDTPEARERIEEINQQTKSVGEQAKKMPILMANATVPESDWLLYFDRVKIFGEQAAVTWMLEKHPEL